jgi:heptosyltransferase-2
VASGRIRLEKILVLALPGIGDLLLVTPTLRVLRREFPRAEIVVLVMYRPCLEALEGNPNVDRLLFWEFFQEGRWRSLRFLWQLRKERFDASILAFPANRIHYNLAQFLIGAKLRVAYRYYRQSWRNLFFLNNRTLMERLDVHNVEANLRLLRFLGIEDPAEDGGLDFPLAADDHSVAERLVGELPGDKALVAMHAWSTELKQMWRKCWDYRRFAALIDSLHADGKYEVVLFEGPHDKVTNDKILSLTGRSPLVIRGTTLPQSAAVLARCSVLVTNDSGLLHVAAAVKTPTVAIFGPTNAYRYHPYGVPYELVWKRLSCSPCFYFSSRSLRCKWGDFRCLERIEVDDVKRSVERLLSCTGSEGRS